MRAIRKFEDEIPVPGHPETADDNSYAPNVI